MFTVKRQRQRRRRRRFRSYTTRPHYPFQLAHFRATAAAAAAAIRPAQERKVFVRISFKRGQGEEEMTKEQHAERQKRVCNKLTARAAAATVGYCKCLHAVFDAKSTEDI